MNSGARSGGGVPRSSSGRALAFVALLVSACLDPPPFSGRADADPASPGTAAAHSEAGANPSDAAGAADLRASSSDAALVGSDARAGGDDARSPMPDASGDPADGSRPVADASDGSRPVADASDGSRPVADASDGSRPVADASDGSVPAADAGPVLPPRDPTERTRLTQGGNVAASPQWRLDARIVSAGALQSSAGFTLVSRLAP